MKVYLNTHPKPNPFLGYFRKNNSQKTFANIPIKRPNPGRFFHSYKKINFTAQNPCALLFEYLLKKQNKFFYKLKNIKQVLLRVSV